MECALVLRWRLNKRLIELEDGSTGQTIGVVRKSGGARYLRWLGFMDLDTAKSLPGAKPVKLIAECVGVRKGIGTEWTAIPEGQHVQGCLVENGVYGIAATRPRVV
jgi:hypothetical protein